MTIKAEKCLIYTGDSPVKARVNIVLDDMFIIKGVKIIDGKQGMFIAMPDYYNRTHGVFRDVCHPMNNDCRIAMQEAALAAYDDALAQLEGEGEGE